MDYQVFGCPKCRRPFQVALLAHAQQVQCPSCQQPVEIPALVVPEHASATATVRVPNSAAEQVFACSHCQGQFGVTSEMLGQHVGCPHCQRAVLIEGVEPDAGVDPVAGDEGNPQIVITPKAKSNKRKPPSAKSPTTAGAPPQSEKRSPATERFKAEAEHQSEASATSRPKPSKQANQSTHSTKQSPGAKKQTNRASQESRSTAKSKLPPVQPVRRAPKTGGPGRAGESLGAVQAHDATQKLEPTNSNANFDHETGSERGAAPLVAVSANDFETGERAKASVSDAPADTGAPTDAAQATNPIDQVKPPVEGGAAKPAEPASITHLLPPTFDVLDPEQLNFRSGEEFKILLPDGDGGVAQFDQRIVRVKHGDEQVTLVALSPAQKRRRRLIQNVIAILLGIAMIAIAFMMLL